MVNNMDIALCFDSNIACYVGTLMTSIIENNRNCKINFYIVHEGSLTEKHISNYKKYAKLYDNVIVHIICAELPLDILPLTHYSPATFLRIFLPDLLPKNLDKVLYLDIDMLVCGDIRAIFETNLDNAYFAVTIDENEYSTTRFNNLGIPFEEWKGYPYFNAGMMLLNLNEWRKNDITKKSVEYMNNHKDIYFEYADQDVLNILYRDKAKIVSLKYNMGVAFLGNISNLHVRKEYHNMIEEAVDDPRVIHMYGFEHPWYRDAKNPYVCVWKNYAKKTADRIKYKRYYSGVTSTIRYFLFLLNICESPNRSKYEKKYYEKSKTYIK